MLGLEELFAAMQKPFQVSGENLDDLEASWDLYIPTLSNDIATKTNEILEHIRGLLGMSEVKL